MTPSSAARPVFILNGPNLNRLGKREPAIYGSMTLAEIEAQCRAEAGDLPIVFRQSNSEAQLIDWIHEAAEQGSGIIINPAAYSFTSLAILDALKMFDGPIIELHISNIHRREEYYHRSYVSRIATAVIAGLGPGGYRHAVRAMREMLGQRRLGPAPRVEASIEDAVDERGGARLLRIAQHPFGWALFDDRPRFHEYDVGGDLAGEAQLVRDDDCGPAPDGQIPDHAQHLAGQFRIERRRRLVEQHDPGIHDQRSHDGHALLLPAGERRPDRRPPCRRGRSCAGAQAPSA